jgi:hypothetical protein
MRNVVGLDRFLAFRVLPTLMSVDELFVSMSVSMSR